MLALLVELLGVKSAIEVGVFTGYSSLAVALALPPGGRLVAFDRDEKTMAVAQRYDRLICNISTQQHLYDLMSDAALHMLSTSCCTGAYSRLHAEQRMPLARVSDMILLQVLGESWCGRQG